MTFKVYEKNFITSVCFHDSDHPHMTAALSRAKMLAARYALSTTPPIITTSDGETVVQPHDFSFYGAVVRRFTTGGEGDGQGATRGA